MTKLKHNLNISQTLYFYFKVKHFVFKSELLYSPSKDHHKSAFSSIQLSHSDFPFHIIAESTIFRKRKK